MTIGTGLLGTFSNGMEKFLYQFFSLFSDNWILCSSKESVTVALLLGLADALLDELVPEFHFCLRIDISFLVRVDSGILWILADQINIRCLVDQAILKES
jgi:hypothetical protein